MSGFNQLLNAASTVSNSNKINRSYDDRDTTAKRILSNKSIMAHILKELVTELDDVSIDYIENNILSNVDTNGCPLIKGIDSIDKSITDGERSFDLLFEISHKEIIKLKIDIEHQHKFNPGYSLATRGIYYLSRLISNQYGVDFSGSDYDKIKKVYSIWICTNPAKDYENVITRFNFLPNNTYFSKQEYDKQCLIIVCIPEELNNESGSLMRLLHCLFRNLSSVEERANILEKDFNINKVSEIKEEMYNMNGYEKERQEGKQEGRLEGIISALKDIGYSKQEIIDYLKNKRNYSEKEINEAITLYY